jgi:hypothetical protein
MSNATKAAYTKPTLIEYGSLAERTKIFGMDPEEPEAVVPGLASVAITGVNVTATVIG